MNKRSFDKLAGRCDFRKPAPYYIIENGVKNDGPPHCITGKLCSFQNCPLAMWFEMLFGYEPNHHIEQSV